ncbi:MAG: UDP-N-acetylmuramoyl-L-alanine--D-glutamate ligase [Acidobacteriota bacterium]|nr:UDP-N-acetylmuramoyl-L-alanine--D-glutamate ligase [Acidobacteriota bacterium]
MNVPWTAHEWKKVLVYGLGSSGRSAVRLLGEHGVRVVAVDRRPAAELNLGELSTRPGVDLLLGSEPTGLPQNVDGVVVSPGVPQDRPLLNAARAQGLVVISEVELASIFVNGPIVGITGSNGKSTTTALTGALLESAGFDVEVCGNIGVPLSSRLTGPEGRVFVVELSSFQLESIATLHPRVAALLNITPDHLDRHGGFRRYLEAKTAIFGSQTGDDFAVLNADDPIVRDVGTAARRRYFSRLSTPQEGCYLEGEAVFQVEPNGTRTRLFERRDLRLLGAHNVENAMAAALIALSVGAASETFAHALSVFEGLPHRMQVVARVDGVIWLDDSKGTNVGATLKSLADLRNRSVHLIVGGRNKGADLSLLAEEVERTAKRVYLIGEAASELAHALPPSVAQHRSGDLESAVRAAAEGTCSGDTVLLSPACASFDQYESYIQRGEHFQRLVLEMTGERDG